MTDLPHPDKRPPQWIAVSADDFADYRVGDKLCGAKIPSGNARIVEMKQEGELHQLLLQPIRAYGDCWRYTP